MFRPHPLGRGAPPPKEDTYCVREDYALAADLDIVWTDAGSGAKWQCSAVSAPKLLCCFVSPVSLRGASAQLAALHRSDCAFYLGAHACIHPCSHPAGNTDIRMDTSAKPPRSLPAHRCVCRRARAWQWTVTNAFSSFLAVRGYTDPGGQQQPNT